MAKRTAQKKAQDRVIRNLERALKEERLGLAAVATAIVRESHDPLVLVGRLERMARLAQENKKLPQQTRDAVRAGTQLMGNAVAREVKKPQKLFDPDTGHVQPDKVEPIVEPEAPHGGQTQLGENGAGEPGSLATLERTATERADAQEAAEGWVMKVFREKGGMSDDELVVQYIKMEMPYLPRPGIIASRRVLTKSGRLVKDGDRYNLFENVHT